MRELILNIFDTLFYGGRKKYQKEVNSKKDEISKAYKEFKEIDNPQEYLTKKSLSEWKKKWLHLSKISKDYTKHHNKVKTQSDHELEKISSILHVPSFFKKRNDDYLNRELRTHKEYFDSLEKYPLTQKQREAIIVDEHRNLVVAGAGTGKTSTLIGKTGYILKKGSIIPNEILLLSFGRDPREEMKERLIDRFGFSLDVNTFHGLGMKLIAEAREEKPSISKLSSDTIQLQHYISQVIENKKQDKRFLQNLNKFFLSQTEYKSLWEFDNLGEYYNHLRANNIRSLKGDLVKSYEELEIANYLYTNGIKYEYEAKYEHNTASKLYGQYTPDFFLPDYEIYIEHFGINRNGDTAPFVPRERYLDEMKWKRQTHLNYETTLLETYSYERFEGKLLDNLRRKLEQSGVKLVPITEDDIFNRLNKLGYVQPISNLISTFLILFKSSGMSLQSLRQKAKEMKDSDRSTAFVELFEPIYYEYEANLRSSREIDFNDMIIKATQYLNTGKVKINYKYILVDEFQDISQSRNRLLLALLDQNRECKLFCVGDDWQSIYRFAGSDLNIMTDFEDIYGSSEIMLLDETFRFNDKICEFSTKFIQKNPIQIPKQLKTHDHIEKPAVSIIPTDDIEYEIRKILYELNKKGGAVFIIGRYGHLKPQVRFDYPNLSIEYLTAHKSKGTQADYVIIIGLEAGKMGFPCEISDDKVLNLVLSKQDSFPHSEERRLFYVAVTRAKKHVYLLSDMSNPSIFIKEVTSGGYLVNYYGGGKEELIKCPRCETGDIIIRKGHFGEFYSCTNYPYCDYRPPRCPQCKSGYLQKKGRIFVCSECNHRTSPCSNCDGVEVLRSGQYGRFYGCSNYPECKQTRNIR